MSGALRRTPSPHQLLGNAGKTVAAGVAAAGAAVGSALASIREDDKNAYADHETWSEEADAKKTKPAGASSERALSWPLAVGAHDIEARDTEGRRARTSVIVK